MKSLPKTPGSFVDSIVSVSRYLGFACLIGIAGMLSFGALSRYFFQRPFRFSDEIAGVLMIPLILLSLAWVFQIEGHTRVDLVTRKLSAKVQAWLRTTSEFLTLIVLTIIAREFYRQMVTDMLGGSRFRSMFAWQLWPVKFVGLLGLSLAIVYMAKRFFAHVSELRGRNLG